MTKRFMIFVSDDLHLWLTNEAESMGIPSATLAIILLNEAKKARGVQASAQIASDKMKENFAKLFEASFESAFKKGAENEVAREKKYEAQENVQITGNKIKEQLTAMFETGFESVIKNKLESSENKVDRGENS